MLRDATFLASAGALVLSAIQTARLVRGSSGREHWTWIGITAVLLVAAVSRSIIGLREMAETTNLPAGIEFVLLANTLVIAVIFWQLRPILMQYRAAERRRLESDERFRRALSAASDPVAMIDTEGVYTYVNDAGCEFFRYPREAILGRQFRKFMVEGDSDDRDTTGRAAVTGATTVEREIVRGDGTRVAIECDLIALGDGSILIIGHDLTARREAALAQARVQRLEAVSALAAGVAHDFNNLLTIIRGALELATEYGTERVPLDGAMRAAARASVLTQELIEFSRATIERSQRPEPPVIDLAPAVADTTRTFAVGLDPRVGIQFHDSRDTLSVRADMRDVDRVCTNLLTNAQDAVIEAIERRPGEDHPGRIEVELRRGVQDETRNPVAEVVVRDNGAGVPDDLRDKIFEPFFTTKAGGRRFGLGLAATNEIVTALGGTISVSSAPGGGSIFTVRLPIVSEPLRVDTARPLPAA